MRSFTGTENEFELDGVTYIAKQQQNCDGCAFIDPYDCGSIRLPHCASYSRKDDVSVIFIRKPATPESQPAMTSTKHTPATTTAKPLDFSKPVQTRDGHSVRILCIDRKHETFPVVALWMNNYGVEVLDSWTLKGANSLHGARGELDLIQAPQPRKHAELIKRWAEDDSMRIKFKAAVLPWTESTAPKFGNTCEYEEILPGDPLY